MKKKQLVKRTLLLLLFVVTCAVPILSGTGGVAFQPKQVTADAAGTYEKTALILQPQQHLKMLVPWQKWTNQTIRYTRHFMTILKL